MGVLDEMTRGITERKAAAAGPKLTPVGTEASSTKPSLGVPEVPEVFLTNEAIADIAKDLRAQAAQLVLVADGLDRLTAKPSTPPVDEKALAVEAKKAAEAESDRKAAERESKKAPKSTEEFTEHLATISDEAKAAVFVAADATVEEVLPAVRVTNIDRWSCPDHGQENLKTLTSRKGRVYAACQTTGCGKFERE